MRGWTAAFKLFAMLLLTLLAWTGCESTDDGGSVSGGVYYGTGYYDPWYYGNYWDDPDIIVSPPDRPSTPHPEHPIARPPSSPSVSPRPMPSIPSTPRVSARR